MGENINEPGLILLNVKRIKVGGRATEYAMISFPNGMDIFRNSGDRKQNMGYSISLVSEGGWQKMRSLDDEGANMDKTPNEDSLIEEGLINFFIQSDDNIGSTINLPQSPVKNLYSDTVDADGYQSLETKVSQYGNPSMDQTILYQEYGDEGTGEIIQDQDMQPAHEMEIQYVRTGEEGQQINDREENQPVDGRRSPPNVLINLCHVKHFVKETVKETVTPLLTALGHNKLLTNVGEQAETALREFYPYRRGGLNLEIEEELTVGSGIFILKSEKAEILENTKLDSPGAYAIKAMQSILFQDFLINCSLEGQNGYHKFPEEALLSLTDFATECTKKHLHLRGKVCNLYKIKTSLSHKWWAMRTNQEKQKQR